MGTRQSYKVILFTLLLLSSIGLGQKKHSEEPKRPPLDAKIGKIIEALDAEEFEEREKAQKQLLALGPKAFHSIYNLYLFHSLTLEQKKRIEPYLKTFQKNQELTQPEFEKIVASWIQSLEQNHSKIKKSAEKLSGLFRNEPGLKKLWNQALIHHQEIQILMRDQHLLDQNYTAQNQQEMLDHKIKSLKTTVDELSEKLKSAFTKNGFPTSKVTVFNDKTPNHYEFPESLLFTPTQDGPPLEIPLASTTPLIKVLPHSEETYNLYPSKVFPLQQTKIKGNPMDLVPRVEIQSLHFTVEPAEERTQLRGAIRFAYDPWKRTELSTIPKWYWKEIQAR